jgi:ubiquinone/menaquinone biosynthesis C-methylase UbiE
MEPQATATLAPATDWASIELPATRADRLNLRNPLTLLAVLRQIFIDRKRQRVALPEGVPGMERIPKYVLQEFHNLPNGNYSSKFAHGYATGFDRVMLGTLRKARAQAAERMMKALSTARDDEGFTALDVGCGAGYMAAALHAQGFAPVWGIDPSPYLLKQSARLYPAAQHPGLRWLHGVGEELPLPDASIDAVGVCFVFHEVPPAYLRKILAELRRVARPGAQLAVIEPSPVHWFNSYWRQWRRFGWRGVYFKLLSQRVYEPFVEAWHKLELKALLAEYGFTLTSDHAGCPLRIIHASFTPNQAS